jgi:Family of unknown function (DUF5670)
MSQRRETAPLKKTIPSAKGPESLPFFLASPLLSGALIKGFAVRPGTEREATILWTIAVILLVLWALGMVSSYTAGGLVHLLLVIALIVVVFQFIGGRRSV